MRLDRSDLRRLGASVHALDFYDEYDDIAAYRGLFGGYKLVGYVNGRYSDPRAMIRALEHAAREVGF